MRTSFIVRLCTTAAFVAALAAPAAAQTQQQPLTGGDDQSMLIGLGLTFLNVSDSTGVGANANVLFNTLDASENGRLGVVGDFGINDFDGGTLTTLMGGIRYTFNATGRVLPYGQVLVGIAHCCSDTDFVPSLGGGVDVAWRDNLNFRGELAFHFTDATATRFFLGISLPVSK